MLTGGINANTVFVDKDFRKIAPRFQSEHLNVNLGLLEVVKAMALEKQCTPSQISLAWLLARGEDIIPIPGTKRIQYLEQNLASLNVTLDRQMCSG